MRLRHKKPENSYAGQANLESNEVVDEYFEEEIPTGKKNKIHNRRDHHDSVSKYAKILVDFVHGINTDYKTSIKKFPIKNQASNHRKPEDKPLATSSTEKKFYQNSLRNKKYSPEKQQLDNQQKNQIVGKKIAKPVLIRHQVPLKKQSHSLPSVPLPEKKNNAIQKPVPKKQQIDLTGEDNYPQNQNHLEANGLTHTTPNQMMFGNPGSFANLNGIGPAVLQNLQYQMPIYQQLLLEQIKENPNLLIYSQPYQTQNLLGMLNLQHFLEMQRNYSLFSNLPNAFNNNQEKISQANVSNSINRNVNEDVDDKQDRCLSKEFIKKKSCTHVTIAYHIHCEKLRQAGKLSSSYNCRSVQLSELDPTFAAKKFRRRKNPQILNYIPESCSANFK